MAAGDRTTLNQLLEHLRQLIGSDVEPRYEAARLGDVKHSQADVSAAERELGFRPRVSVEEGLRLTLGWYQRT